MASEQALANDAIAKAVAKVTGAAIQAMPAATSERPQSVSGCKIGRPAMKLPTFNWEADNKYSELKTFRLEVKNILTTYNTLQIEQLAMEKNWLGRKGLQLIELLTYTEKDTCSTFVGLFKILTNKFRPQFSERIKSLHSFVGFSFCCFTIN